MAHKSRIASSLFKQGFQSGSLSFHTGHQLSTEGFVQTIDSILKRLSVTGLLLNTSMELFNLRLLILHLGFHTTEPGTDIIEPSGKFLVLLL